MLKYFSGLSDCFSGFGLILQKGIRRYVIVPLVINIILFAGAIVLIAQQMQAWIDALLPSWLSWLEWLIWPFFAITVILLVFFSFTLVANLIAAPFNSLLSAAVEQHLTGKKPENMVEESLTRTTVRTIGAEIRKMLYFVRWLIPLIILTIVPVINVVSPFAWFLFTVWSFSLEYMDNPLGNRGLLFDAIRDYNRQNRMRSLGFGTGVFVMTSIPILNFIAMPVAVAGATKMTTATSTNEVQVTGNNNG